MMVRIFSLLICLLLLAASSFAQPGCTLSFTATATPTACGGASAWITLIPDSSSGTTPFYYSLDGGPYDPNPYNLFINIPAGVHTLNMRDANGCNAPQVTLIVTNGTKVLGNATSEPTKCRGSADGKIFANPASGIGPYQYSLNGGPFQGGSAFSDLAPGNYNVTIKDANNCLSDPIPVSVAQGPPITGIAVATATTCPVLNDGEAEIVVQGYINPGSRYSLNGGPQQSVNVFSNLAPGSYYAIIHDQVCDASAQINFIIDMGPPLSVNITKTDVSCNGGNNGTITASINGNGVGKEYSIDNINYSANNTFTNLTAGSYTIYFRQMNGCSGTQAVTISQPAVLSLSLAAQPVKCKGQNNGVITATPSGGTAPYQYSLDNVTYQTANTFSVAQGTHTVYIKDANGCSQNKSISVTEPAALTANAIATQHTTCNGAADGIITASANGGTSPYQYTLNSGSPQAGNVFNGLQAGNHIITVTDANGCTVSSAVTINPGPPLTATLAKTDVICNGTSTGSITVTISANANGTQEYSLNNNTYQASNVFNNLPAGNYVVYFRQGNGCSGTTSITLTEPPVLTLAAATQPAKCFGQNSGSITVTGSGGISPYQYSLDGNNYQNTNTFNVAAGNYTVYIKDSKGCIKNQTVTVTEPAALSLTAATQNATCTGGNDGIITVNASGGASPFQYAVDGTNFQAANTFNVLPGNYNVTIRDNGGCTATLPVTVGLTNNLTVDAGNDTTICEGTSAQLKATSNGLQYAWSPASTLTGVNTATPSASPAVTTQYLVTVTAGSCSASDAVTVNVLPAPLADAGPAGIICHGQAYQLQGSGGISYEWTPAATLSDAAIANPLASPSQTTQYFLKVTDASGCTSLIPASVTVQVTPPLTVITNPADTIVAAGDQFQLQAASAGTIYTWSPATGLSNPNIPNPVVTVTTDMFYKVVAETVAGCTGEGYVRIRVYGGPELYVPTAFTPNGDGKNDVFRPFPVSIKQLKHFKIYNRWGQLLYSTQTLMAGWNGKFAGKDQPAGVYVWIVEGLTKDDKVITKKGTVTLIR